MSFWVELRRRNVVKVGAAYAIVAWLLLQVAVNAFPALQLPAWTVTFVTVLLLIGFPIALILAWAYEVTPEGIKPTKQVPLADSITHATGQKLNYVVTVLLVLAVGYMAADTYLFTNAAPESAGPIDTRNVANPVNRGAGASAVPAAGTELAAASSAPAVAREVLPNSVAVLPFANMSPNPDDDYFAAGIHEEVLNYLAKLKSLSVIGRTSMLRYANTDKSYQQIADELGVETVMEGSVRYAGDRVRVTTQLIDVATGAHLWSEAYERPFEDIFAIQADIAMNVANALNAEFSDEEQQGIEREPTRSPAAYALYLQAQDLVGVGEQGPRIQELLDQALAIDPDFALAYGVKAVVYAQGLISTSEGSAGNQADLEPLIREYADKALGLDANSPAALGALGNLASYSWRWTEAKEAYNRQYEISEIAGAPAMWFRAWSGDHAQAIKIAERSVELNPLDWTAHWSYGIALQYAGDYQRAAAKFRDGIALAPTLSLQHSWLAHNEIALGDKEAARRELQLAEQLLGRNRSVISLVDAAYGYGRIGDDADARRLFDEVSAVADGGQDIGSGGWALIHLAVGQADEALEWLERGVDKARRHELDAGYYSLMNIKMNFAADPVLEQPEFVAVRAELTGD